MPNIALIETNRITVYFAVDNIALIETKQITVYVKQHPDDTFSRSDRLRFCIPFQFELLTS
jgi:hypothetical protein